MIIQGEVCFGRYQAGSRWLLTFRQTYSTLARRLLFYYLSLHLGTWWKSMISINDADMYVWFEMLNAKPVHTWALWADGLQSLAYAASLSEDIWGRRRGNRSSMTCGQESNVMLEASLTEELDWTGFREASFSKPTCWRCPQHTSGVSKSFLLILRQMNLLFKRDSGFCLFDCSCGERLWEKSAWCDSSVPLPVHY